MLVLLSLSASASSSSQRLEAAWVLSVSGCSKVSASQPNEGWSRRCGVDLSFEVSLEPEAEISKVSTPCFLRPPSKSGSVLAPVESWLQRGEVSEPTAESRVTSPHSRVTSPHQTLASSPAAVLPPLKISWHCLPLLLVLCWPAGSLLV